MRTSLKICGTFLANFSILRHEVVAYLPPISFESPEFVPLQIVSHTADSGWDSRAGIADITADGEGYGGGQALRIRKSTEEEAWLRREIKWDPSESVAFIDFRIKPAADPEGSPANFFANGSRLAFQRNAASSVGALWAYHGNDGGEEKTSIPAQWHPTAGIFEVTQDSNTSSTWLRITLRQDYERNVWDLFIDGRLAAAGLGFDGRGSNLESLEFFGSKTGDTLIDDLLVIPFNTLFEDSDKDGIPDEWEIENRSNPYVYDRDLIKPGTEKSYLDHYIDSLWPDSSPQREEQRT